MLLNAGILQHTRFPDVALGNLQTMDLCQEALSSLYFILQKYSPSEGGGVEFAQTVRALVLALQVILFPRLSMP